MRKSLFKETMQPKIIKFCILNMITFHVSCILDQTMNWMRNIYKYKVALNTVYSLFNLTKDLIKEKNFLSVRVYHSRQCIPSFVASIQIPKIL